MLQSLCGVRQLTPSTTADRATGITQEGTSWNVLLNANGYSSHPWSCAGVFRNLVVRVSAPIAAGQTVVITLQIGSVDTALTVTLNAGETEARDVVHEASVSPGQWIRFVHNPVTDVSTSYPQFAIEFEGSVEAESGYGVAGGAPSTSVPSYVGPFYSSAWNTTLTNASNLCPLAGTLTRMDAALSGYAGWNSTSGFVFVLMKNGTAQDGTGGTPNTTISLLYNQYKGVSNFSLAVSPGDVLAIRCTPTGSSIRSYGAGVSVACTADTDGEYAVCGHTLDPLNTTATEVLYPFSYATSWSGSGASLVGGVAPVVYSKFRAELSAAPGAGGSGDAYALRLRKNASDGSADPVIAITEIATAGTDATHQLLIEDGDTIQIQCTPSNTPAATPWAKWAAVARLYTESAWVPVADYVEQEIPASAFPGGAARVLGDLWTEDTGSPLPVVKARLYNVTDGASAGESAEVSSATPTACDFGVTLASGTKRYTLQVTSDTPNIDIFYCGRGVGP